ncbi:hypothetical protein [Neobacillus fumarioli]|uniref:hypothetical protein n=1 Tax=Neobacillus fumarioli TaxID=105229 RepID=UPI000835ED06|nr:hypothetical protein [Neobacillus fumarioli]
MPIKNFFLIFRKSEYEQELRRKLASLEANFQELEKTLQSLQEQSPHEEVKIIKEPPIIIEKVNIEKIILDKYEVNNNFGQLGIKELKGKLNIGATYGSEFTPKQEEERAEKTRHEKVQPETKQKHPKIHIRSRRENDE